MKDFYKLSRTIKIAGLGITAIIVSMWLSSLFVVPEVTVQALFAEISKALLVTQIGLGILYVYLKGKAFRRPGKPFDYRHPEEMT